MTAQPDNPKSKSKPGVKKKHHNSERIAPKSPEIQGLEEDPFEQKKSLLSRNIARETRQIREIFFRTTLIPGTCHPFSSFFRVFRVFRGAEQLP